MEDLLIRPLRQDDAQRLLTLECDNRAFFQRFTMRKTESFYTLEAQRARLEQIEADVAADRAYYFGLFEGDSGALLGYVRLTEVVRGDIQSAWIGYCLDQGRNGRGYATYALREVSRYAFETLRLHRIEAGVQPVNAASMKVLVKAGYQKEGLARENARIDGAWQDHYTFAMLEDDLPVSQA